MLLPPRPGSMALILSLLALHIQTSPAQFNAITNKGCYSSVGNFEDQGPYKYQSSGYCQKLCAGMNKPVMALKGGSDCLCGDLLPSESSKAEDSDCSVPCNGYDQQTCGGDNSYSVALTGTTPNVGTQDDDSDNDDSSSPPSLAPKPEPQPEPSPIVEQSTVVSQSLIVSTPRPITLPPKLVTVGGSTVIQTLPVSTAYVGVAVPAGDNTAPAVAPSTSTPSAPAEPGPSSGAKIGIAVGVVAGALALTAAGLFFIFKRRLNNNKPNSPTSRHRGNSSVGAFAIAGSTPARSGSHVEIVGSSSDSRLDPTMVETRRQSNESTFDDSTDYSRRILKVTNPNPSDRPDSYVR